jgi:GLPGLI family protein
MLTDETKQVFGYPCKKAFIQKNEQIEMVAWYTSNFKCNYSSTGDTSIPGTILEIYNPKTGNLVTAIDLQIETNPILIPQKGAMLVTREAFNKIKKTKKN